MRGFVVFNEMRILIVNDDGIEAKGLKSLAASLAQTNEVWVIAPMAEKSGASHSLTFHDLLNYYELENLGYRRFVLDGTPCDCVKFGIEIIMDGKPDVVLSGINNVANIGSDVIYSGTVNAAIEGSMLGIKSIAISLDCENNNYNFACDFVCEKLQYLIELLPDSDTIWNINIPHSDKSKILGVKFSTCGKRVFADEYQYIDHKGWLITGHPIEVNNSTDSDVYLHAKGFITIAPIKTDFNNYDVYNAVKDIKL